MVSACEGKSAVQWAIKYVSKRLGMCTLDFQTVAEDHFGQTVAKRPFNHERLVKRSLGSQGSQKVAQRVFGPERTWKHQDTLGSLSIMHGGFKKINNTWANQIRDDHLQKTSVQVRYISFDLEFDFAYIYITSYALQSRYGVTYGPLTLCNLARCQPPLAQGKGWMEGWKTCVFYVKEKYKQKDIWSSYCTW